MEKNSVERNTTFLASLGSALEYYDFIVYGMMAKYLSTIFFPGQNDTVALLKTWSIFALGYFARPFGGTLAGMFGDRIGRKPVFLFLTLSMAFSTLVIGVLPPFEKIGILATFLLIGCRLLQGLSFGGELPGATTIVAELGLNKRRALRQSFILASATIGALLATFVLALLSKLLNESEMLRWGWRVPFLLGGVLGIMLFFARKNLAEPSAFVDAKETVSKNDPLFSVIKEHFPSVLTGIGLTAFVSSLVVSNLFFPFYMNKYFQFSESDVYFAATLSMFFSAIMLPIAGRLADRFARSILLRRVGIAYLIFAIVLFQVLALHSVILLIVFMLIHQLFIALFSACYFPMVVDLFPTSVRYTGVALCYNVTYALMGMLPMLATSLLLKYQTPWVLPILLSCMAALSVIASLYFERITGITTVKAKDAGLANLA